MTGRVNIIQSKSFQLSSCRKIAVKQKWSDTFFKLQIKDKNNLFLKDEAVVLFDRLGQTDFKI